MDLSDLRREFGQKAFPGFRWPDAPFPLISDWLNDAITAGIQEPNAVTLSTCGNDKVVSSRTVLIKEFSEKEGFIFYTHYHSRKGRALEENPHASLLFYWRALEKQISIEGTVQKVAAEKSDQYFYSRPLESRISAVVSAQSEILDDFPTLIKRWEALKNSREEIRRPENWGGYRLVANSISFWQGGPHRLHERMVYQNMGTHWSKHRLFP